MKLVDGSQTFDRVDLGAVKLNRKKKAGAHAVPVHENGASAANTVFAANMRACETERLSEKIGEKQPRFDRALVSGAIHFDANCVAFIHCCFSSARCFAASKARRVRASTRCARRSLLSRRSEFMGVACAAAFAAAVIVLSSSELLVSNASALTARTTVSPPITAMRHCVQRAPDIVSVAAAAATAKSPRRWANSSKPQPVKRGS